MGRVGYRDPSLEELTRRYGEHLQQAVGDTYVGLTAKWSVGDLLPGLSDLDFRVVLAGDAQIDDWIAVDRAASEIHGLLAGEKPSWWRYLEHTPGCGLSLTEVENADYHHPEYSCWHTCHGRDAAISAALHRADSRPWSAPVCRHG